MSVGRFQGDLPQRTFEFAIAVIDLVDAIPEGTKGWVIGKQLARSGTSIGANICETDQALTEAEFAHRCSIARKESAETSYWLRLCERTGLLSAREVESCLQECADLSRILSTIVKKCQQHAIVNS